MMMQTNGISFYKRLGFILLSFCLGSFGASGNIKAEGRSQTDAWTLTAEHARCLLGGLDGYIASGEDPIVILLGRDCPVREDDAIQPKLPPVDDNSKTTLRQVPVFIVVSDGEPIPTVVYRRRQLECLRSFVVGEGSELVLVPRRPCEYSD